MTNQSDSEIEEVELVSELESMADVHQMSVDEDDLHIK